MIKRCFDAVLAGLSLAILALPMLVIALMVRRKLGTPVLFRQTRPGLGGREFELIKFRSMRETTDAGGEALPDAERMTAFGAWLRRTSLDELPELWNVLRGDMSLVGPRPLLTEYLPLYSQAQRRRHEVRPGITGWAQIHGRNAIDWDEKLQLDVWYVDNRSFWLDLRIIASTVRKVLTAEGVTQDGHVTTEKFRGRSGSTNE